MFRYFENLIDPYQPHDERAEVPRRLLPFVLHYLRPARGLIAAAMVLGLLGALGEAALIGFASQLVDILTAAEPGRLWDDFGSELGLMIAIALILLPLIRIVHTVMMSQGYFAPMGALIRWRTHRRMLRQSLSFFTDDFAGRIANKQIQLAPAINDSVFQLLDALWFAMIYVIGTAAVLANNDPRLLLPLGLWIAGFAAIAWYFLPRTARRGMEVAEARSTLAGRIVDSYTNIQTVKLFAHADREADYARDALEDFRAAFARQTRLFSLLTIAQTALGAFLIGSVIGYAVWLWSAGAVTVGAIAAAAALVLRLNGMADWIMWTLSTLFQNIGTVQEGMATISKPLEMQDRAGAAPLRLETGEIRFERVSHHYGRGAGGVQDVSFTVAGGEKVGLVGRSGAGKSTLVNLALRFYAPEDGRVLIDGQDLAGLAQESVREKISMVTQDTSLLHRSIRDNILYGRPDASEAEMVAAAKKVHAHAFIEALRDPGGRAGYDALVGERGVRLSGGQRQRIALARAVLKDAPILILDEATSALDSEVEAEIQEELYGLMEGRTVIAIAHRLSTIARMDRIVVLDEGRVVEDGPHEVLLERGGLYARLWARQSGGFIARDAEADATGGGAGLPGEAAE